MIAIPTSTALPGGPVSQEYRYDDLYQLIYASGQYNFGPGKKNLYTNNFSYDTIGNMTKKEQVHTILQPSLEPHKPKETNYVLNYIYGSPKPHAVTDAGDKLYTYDLNGNMTGWKSKTSGQNRVIIWNEENRVKEINDNGKSTYFLYDDSGERVVKRGEHGETLYINRFYSVRNGELGTKHIFAGETRVLSKLVKTPPTTDINTDYGDFPGSKGILNALGRGRGNKFGIFKRLDREDVTLPGTLPIEKDQFYYHGDHLGSSNIITDLAGSVYQHLEYFPYGETWVEEGGSGQMPYYRFTGKELDPETGLYYFGARYYDPVLSRWISADPILDKYLPRRGNKKSDLSGFGGVYSPINLALYTYSQGNPLILRDPDGRHTTGNHYKILEASLTGEYSASSYVTSLMKYMTKAVDAWKYQGTEIKFTRLHGMAGRNPEKKWQTREEAMAFTQATVDSLIAEAAEYAKREAFVEAIALLGTATHVVEDAVQHKYEKWSGWKAVFNPIGLLIHWIRDLWLGKKELQENVASTQKVYEQYKGLVGEDVFRKTMEYENAAGKLTKEDKEKASRALHRFVHGE